MVSNKIGENGEDRVERERLREEAAAVASVSDAGIAKNVDERFHEVLAEILVSIVVDGRAVEGSRPAVLRAGTVLAPLDPYVRGLADRIEIAASDGRITIVRGDRSVALAIGSPLLRSGSTAARLPIAPFVRDGEANIPLAATARALGAAVSYDVRARVVYVRLPRAPISRMTPFRTYVPPSAPVTFSPTNTPAPRVIVTGMPRPRRTPILIQTPL